MGQFSPQFLKIWPLSCKELIKKEFFRQYSEDNQRHLSPGHKPLHLPQHLPINQHLNNRSLVGVIGGEHFTVFVNLGDQVTP